MKQDKPTKAVTATVSGSDTSPVIYFDGVAAIGMIGGVVQIELAMNQLVPLSDGMVKTRVVSAGHLRLTSGAALALVETIERILESHPELPKAH